MGILSEEIKKRVLLYDGSKGVMLQMGGLLGGASAEEWNLSHPEKAVSYTHLYLYAANGRTGICKHCKEAIPEY